MEVKINELRLGNYLKGKRGPAKVAKIEKESNNIITCQAWYIYEPAYGNSNDFLKPIELNPHILERCGFEWNGMYLEIQLTARKTLRFYEGDCGKMDITQDGKYISFRMGHIKYLHQLQNMYFVLSGEELKILQFKLD